MTVSDSHDDREDFTPYSAKEVREYRPAVDSDPALGPLKPLTGTWSNLRDPDPAKE